MVFPIQWPEPFGLVMVEAMACGTPVIARPLGAATELIEHGRCGFLCDTEHEMVDAIEHVTDLDRKTCRQRAITRFSSEKMLVAYAHLYTRLLDHRVSQTPPERPLPDYSVHA